jgi:hypothetical protein
MIRLGVTSLTLIIIGSAIALSACGGGGGIVSTLPAVFTLAPTLPAAATAVARPIAGAATKSPAPAPQSTASAGASPRAAGAATQPAAAAPRYTPLPATTGADAADQALQQLDKDLGYADTVQDVNSAGDVTTTQALDQLDKSLGSTDTLNDILK